LEIARKDFPGIAVYDSVAAMLARPDLDLITVITPHFNHAELALQVLESGKHCIVEKPMAVTLEQAKAMEDKSRETGLMLTVYQNRRWDGWYQEARKLIAEGKLGDVFEAEFFWGDYISPASWGEWRADKARAGGTLFDWGAHMADWLLGIIPDRVRSVRATRQNRVWNEYTIDDQMCATVYFESGAVGRLEVSYISCQPKPLFRITGTKGAIVQVPGPNKEMSVAYVEDGKRVEYTVAYQDHEHLHNYYDHIAAHLLRGEELQVKPAQCRQAIAILDTAEKSAEAGVELPVPNE
jgi:predicted dehydrogenase